jgi:hypothetical protein
MQFFQPLMQQELFPNKAKKKKKKSDEQLELERYDQDSLTEREERLKFIKQIVPEEYFFGADLETICILQEAKMTFINGEFISTILLSQAFIERLLQIHYESIGFEKLARQGISKIIEHAKANNTIHSFLLPKIDDLRKKRNPFVHLKPHDHEYNITQRILAKGGKNFKQPTELIYIDAKEAIRLMYAIFTTPLC